MKDYIFILGRDPELSMLEIQSYFKARSIPFRIMEHTKQAAIISTDIEPKKAIRDLGGVQKIAEVCNLEEEELYAGSSNKIKYAISCYEGSGKEVNEYLKTRFKEEKLKAALKHSSRKTPFLMPSESLAVDLEIIIFREHVGIRVAVFNPKEYEKRDKSRQRPLHTISIRLAKILINLSGAKEGDTLLDPFCGIGVILMEAKLMGINSIGIDKDKNCIFSARKNIKGDANLIPGDSRNLSRLIKTADTCATEPYLGPFLKKIPMEKEARKIAAELTPIYSAVMREIAKAVKGSTAIIIPRFRLYSGKRVTIDFERIIKGAGLKKEEIDPTIKLPIIYNAGSSNIEREIWVVKKA
ncbi:MAG: DNA methyltransferase [Candidatus Woesearchaeota archaeon]